MGGPVIQVPDWLARTRYTRLVPEVCSPMAAGRKQATAIPEQLPPPEVW